MAQSKILLDTSCYLRLAVSIHPLLFQPFGDAEYCFYCLPELDDELTRNPRLQTKFHWALEREYRDNRKTYLSLGKRERKEINRAYEFIWDYIQTDFRGVSRVDALALAHGYALQISVATDDKAMTEVGAAFDIETFRSLDLLKLMLDADHISLVKVREIVAYWRYWKDVPSDLAEQYLAIFGESTP
ncbi:MAG: DNA-binding protein [Gammaproteobacteria bacterium]|nr:DNA-binding protein [Gammaproteobacteria bacterium]